MHLHIFPQVHPPRKTCLFSWTLWLIARYSQQSQKAPRIHWLLSKGAQITVALLGQQELCPGRNLELRAKQGKQGPQQQATQSHSP